MCSIASNLLVTQTLYDATTDHVSNMRWLKHNSTRQMHVTYKIFTPQCTCDTCNTCRDEKHMTRHMEEHREAFKLEKCNGYDIAQTSAATPQNNGMHYMVKVIRWQLCNRFGHQTHPVIPPHPPVGTRS